VAVTSANRPACSRSWTLTRAGVNSAFVVDDLGCVIGTITPGQCRPAPADRAAPKETGHDQVRV